MLTPVKSTSEELNSAAAMGRRFGEALAEGLNMVMHPLESLKSGVSWLLEKLGIVSKEAAKAKLPEQVTRQQPATVNSDGKVVLPPGGFPSMGFAGMYDNGGTIPRGQFGIVGENGPEIVNGPANVTSRRRTAALASVVAGVMGVAAAPAEAAPLHPYSLPTVAYKQSQPAKSASAPPVMHFETHAPITIYAQPGRVRKILPVKLPDSLTNASARPGLKRAVISVIKGDMNHDDGAGVICLYAAYSAISGAAVSAKLATRRQQSGEPTTINAVYWPG